MSNPASFNVDVSLANSFENFSASAPMLTIKKSFSHSDLREPVAPHVDVILSHENSDVSNNNQSDNGSSLDEAELSSLSAQSSDFDDEVWEDLESEL